jgi:hypothetical protein
VQGQDPGVAVSSGPLNPRPVYNEDPPRLTKGPLERQLAPSDDDGLPRLGAISASFAPVPEACAKRFPNGADCAVASAAVAARPGGRLQTNGAQWPFDSLRFKIASMNGAAWDTATTIHETCQVALEVDLGDRVGQFALLLEETDGRRAWSLDAAAIAAELGEGVRNAFDPKAPKAPGLDNPELSLRFHVRENPQSPGACLTPDLSLGVEPMGVRNRTAFFAVTAPMEKPVMVAVFKPRGLSTFGTDDPASHAVQLCIFALTRNIFIEIWRGISAAAGDSAAFKSADIHIAAVLEGDVRLTAISDRPASMIGIPRADDLPVMGYKAELEFARAMAADDARSPNVLAAATRLFDPETTVQGAAELAPHHLVFVEFHDNLGPAQAKPLSRDQTGRENVRPIRQSRIVGVSQSHRALDAAARRMAGSGYFWTCPETGADEAVNLETAELSASTVVFSVSKLETNVDQFTALRNDTLMFLTHVFQSRRNHTAEDGSGAAETIIGSR